MRRFEASREYVTSDEKFSRRVQCGVEIFEREIVTRIRTSNGDHVPARSKPRLVVTDAISATRDFVSKRRSDIRELDNFLKTVAAAKVRA